MNIVQRFFTIFREAIFKSKAAAFLHARRNISASMLVFRLVELKYFQKKKLNLIVGIIPNR